MRLPTPHPRRYTRRDRGVVIPMFALVMTILILMTSFAIDLGRLRVERRDLQADADAIALDAVQKIAGLTTELAQAAAEAEANASAARNDFPATLTATEVSVGRWNVATQTLDATGPTEYPDAVQIDLTSTIPMYFDLSSEERSVARTGVAVARAQTMGRLGSVFSGVQAYNPTAGCTTRAAVEAQLTFMNHLFTEYFDIEVSGGVGTGADTGTVSCQVTGPTNGLQLDALSYQGLAFSEVTFEQLAGQFAGASPEELAESTVTASDFFYATADALDAHGNTADSEAAADLRVIAAAIDSESGGSSQFAFGDVMSGGTPADCADADGEPKPCAAEAELNVLQLIHAAALAMDGENFVDFQIPVNLPYSNGTVVSPQVSIIESPQVDAGWKYAGQSGPRSAQAKIAVNIPLNGVSLDLSLLGLSGTRLVNGNIPLLIEVARADSLYERILCSPQGRPGSLVDMLVETGAVTIGFGSTTSSSLQQAQDATLNATSQLDGSISIGLGGGLLPLVNVTLDLAAITKVSERQTFEAGVQYDGGHDSNVNLLGAEESHTFTANASEPYYETPWYRYDGGLSGTSITDATFASIQWNAISSGTLTQLLTNGITQAMVHDMISTALEPVITELGGEYVDAILSALGVTLAGADGRIEDVRCQVPALANRG